MLTNESASHDGTSLATWTRAISVVCGMTPYIWLSETGYRGLTSRLVFGAVGVIWLRRTRRIVSAALSPRAVGVSGRRASSGARKRLSLRTATGCEGAKTCNSFRPDLSLAGPLLWVLVGSIPNILSVLLKQNMRELSTGTDRRGDIVLLGFQPIDDLFGGLCPFGEPA